MLAKLLVVTCSRPYIQICLGLGKSLKQLSLDVDVAWAHLRGVLLVQLSGAVQLCAGGIFLAAYKFKLLELIDRDIEQKLWYRGVITRRIFYGWWSSASSSLNGGRNIPVRFIDGH